MILLCLDNAQRMHVVLMILCEDGLYSSMDSSLLARVSLPGTGTGMLCIKTFEWFLIHTYNYQYQ